MLQQLGSRFSLANGLSRLSISLGLPDALHRLGLTDSAVPEQPPAAPEPAAAAQAASTSGCDAHNLAASAGRGLQTSIAAADTALHDNGDQFSRASASGKRNDSTQQGITHDRPLSMRPITDANENRQNAVDNKASQAQCSHAMRDPFQELQPHTSTSKGEAYSLCIGSPRHL